MRGSPHDSRNASRRHGIIPAHAGLTMHDYAFADSLRDHPRACGAHSHQRCVEQTSVGSSPRMRGSQVKDNGATDKPGIIPAHAGLTSSEYTAYRADRDHPRACGAHKQIEATGDPELGSSPRMRGSLMKQAVERRLLGITPAHAGLTGRSTALIPAAKDHPRACGAHFQLWKRARKSKGSSPRMRGSRFLLLEVVNNVGIIPAHAGLTESLYHAIYNLIGSSPRMRGSQTFPFYTLLLIGIIPAHAGLTSRRIRATIAGWDHPRACGAHKPTSSMMRLARGSSPRMRGSPS